MSNEVSYSQHLLSGDAQFVGRIASILKDEGYSGVGEDAVRLAWTFSQDVAAEPGLAESYHSALIADPPVEDPGASNEVITDTVLLSAVVAVMDRVPEEGLPMSVPRPPTVHQRTSEVRNMGKKK